MKKPIYLTPEQRDLLVDICITMSARMSDVANTGTKTDTTRMCGKYCFKRTQEIIDLLTGNPAKPTT